MTKSNLSKSNLTKANIAQAKSAKSTEAKKDMGVEAEAANALEFLTKWNTEILTFYARRYQQYALLPLEILTSKSPEDVKDLPERFLEQLMKDYRLEVSRLSEITEVTTGLDAKAESEYALRIQKAQKDAADILAQARAQAERTLKSAEEQAQKMTELPQEEQLKRA